MKKLISLILTAVASMLIAYSIEKVSSLIRIFEDLQSSFEGYDFTDHYFSNNESHTLDTTIVFVNIGEYEREEIAEMIMIVNACEPKAIGVTTRFGSLTNSKGDTLLSKAIQEADNIVLTAFEDLDSQGFLRTHPYIRSGSREGITTLNKESNQTIRSFPTHFEDGIKRFDHLAIQLASMMSPEKSNRIIRRNKMIENIFYKYNIDTVGLSGYKYFEYRHLKDTSLNQDEFRNKVVIIGFLGDPKFPFSIESKRYSQLNESPFKRTQPDMYDAVIIGNIVSMILDGNYIDSFKWLDHLLTFLLLLLMCYLFSLLYRTANYELWSKLLAFGAIIFFLLLSFIVFDLFRLKIDLRYFYFFLLFAPDSYEILSKNVFKRIGLKE